MPVTACGSRKIGQLNPQRLRQIGGTGLAGPRGLIGSVIEGIGAMQSDHYILNTPPRTDGRSLVVLLVPGIHNLPTEPASQVVP